MPKARAPRKDQLPVREAKNRFSELVRRAAGGENITITLHGEPRAQLTRPADASKTFTVDWMWLRTMRVARGQNTAEALIRRDRDARD